MEPLSRDTKNILEIYCNHKKFLRMFSYLARQQQQQLISKTVHSSLFQEFALLNLLLFVPSFILMPYNFCVRKKWSFQCIFSHKSLVLEKYINRPLYFYGFSMFSEVNETQIPIITTSINFSIIIHTFYKMLV